MKLFFLLLALVLTSNSYAEDVVYTNPKLKTQDDIKAIDTTPPTAEPAIPSAAETLITPEVKKTITNHRPEKFPTPPSPTSQNSHDHVDYNDKKHERYHPPVLIINRGYQASRRSTQTTCDNEGAVCITSYEYPENTIITAENKSPAARTLNIDYFLNNMVAKMGSQGQNIVLKAGEIKNIEILEVAETGYKYRYSFTFNAYLGVADAIHDDDYVYDLPFESQQKWMLYQGYGGKMSHDDRMNYYAYDFKMPEGTNVTAARDGVVVYINDKFSEGGLNPDLKDKTNNIYIQHSDGTLGDYAHIKYHGALVSVGDYIQKGQKIALSGNTGFTANPHLHFAVLKTNKGGGFTSIPIKVKSSAGISDNLKAGNFFQK